MKKENRWTMLFPMIIIWVIAIALFYGMCALEPSLSASPKLFSFGDWLARSQDGILYKVFWMIGDWTDCQGFRSLLGGAALVLSGLVVQSQNVSDGCTVGSYAADYSDRLCRRRSGCGIVWRRTGSGMDSNLPSVLYDSGRIGADLRDALDRMADRRCSGLPDTVSAGRFGE